MIYPNMIDYSMTQIGKTRQMLQSKEVSILEAMAQNYIPQPIKRIFTRQLKNIINTTYINSYCEKYSPSSLELTIIKDILEKNKDSKNE